MNIIKMFRDNYENVATIEKIESIPYSGATIRTTLFRLCIIAEYDNDFVYYVKCYDTLENTLSELSKYSCGTFKEVALLRKYTERRLIV